MKADHIEFLIEEPSMEAFLSGVLPRIMGNDATFAIHVHQGKTDLLLKLESRLRGYAKWLPSNCRIIVLVDRDNDDCRILKQRLESIALSAGLISRQSVHNIPDGKSKWRIVNRVVIEELEAWFFGCWPAVRQSYPKVPANVPDQMPYRNCDAITGGTWEALERIMLRAGYFKGGLRKFEFANEIGKHFRPENCNSLSFMHFRDALLEALSPCDQKV